jgi:L-threonylcarbamoyladenylate synthase
MRDFADDDLLVLDGGPCAIGLESTVVDLSCETPRVLRPGAVSIDDLQRRLGAVEVARIAEQVASPGTAGRHYAPSRPAELVSPASLPARLRAGDEACVVIGTSGVEVTDPHRLIEVPATPEGYAACLYDALREADASDADRILVVEPQGRDGLWLAVWDRLLRATV